MSLLVDTRGGSADLIPGLEAMGLPVCERTMRAGDLAFVGRGEGGDPVSIGIEHKKLPDLIDALNSGRLLGNQETKGGQVPRMVRTYDRTHLIVEGDWERAGDGRVSSWKGKGRRAVVKGSPHAIELRKRLLVVDLRWGTRVTYCKSRRDSLDTIYTLYRVWTDKDLDEHKSHLAVHAPDADSKLKMPMSNFRAALQVWLPSIGFAASKRVEEWVSVMRDGKLRPEPYRLMLKTHSDWSALELPDKHGKVKRLGDKRARDIMEELGTWARN